MCVEMIEVRINPTSMFGRRYGGDKPLEDDLSTLFVFLTKKYSKPATRKLRYDAKGLDTFIWTPSETLLRSQGKVFWTPINLKFNNIAVTDKLIHLYDSDKTRPTTWNGANIAYLQDTEDEDAHVWRSVREMMREKVQQWEAEEAKQGYTWGSVAKLGHRYDLYAELDDVNLFAAKQRYDRALEQFLMESDSHSDTPPPPETAALSPAEGPATAGPEEPKSKSPLHPESESDAGSETTSPGQHSGQHQTQPQPQPDNSLAALISQTLLLLTTRFLQRTQQPKTQTTSRLLSPPLSPIITPETAAKWPPQSPAVLAATANYLTLKSNYMQAGETEEFACWEAGRDIGATEREWLEGLVPEIFEAGYGCGPSGDDDGVEDWDGLEEEDEDDQEREDHEKSEEEGEWDQTR